MYSISDAAKKLGVSRQSIYNRLEKTELSEHVSETDKGKVLSQAGLEILRGLYTVKPDCQEFVRTQHADNKPIGSGQQSNCQQYVGGQPVDSQPTSNGQSTDNQADSYTNSLEEQIDYLKTIVAEKDKQIAVKDEQIFSLTRLTENSQILLKQEQDKNRLLIDTSEATRKQSFWSIFKR